jgi:m7GpppX diphosphatase
METILDNIHYKFIPNSIVSFDNFQITKHIFINDIYEKHEAITQVKGELLVCNDPIKIRKRSKKVIYENYQDYITSLEEHDRDPSKDIWIYNIIDGVAEQDKILYRDDKCIVIPTYIWDSKTVSNLHILCMPLDKTLRTIRSLDERHIPLLVHMRRVTLYMIKHKYNLDESQVKIYFHYEPSTYHLHIHFVNLEVEGGSSVEYSHDLDSVINNLYVFSDYYKAFKLKKRIHVNL